MVDFTGLKRPTRHRFFQFAQWTFAAKSLHPIFVDATRRIIDGVALAHAWNVTQEAKIEQLEARGYWQKAHHIRDSMVHPWEVETFRDRLTVQEWTGPAAFTDSVLSYLLAVAGVRAEDLYWVNKPIQIADVVILPMDGFNPILSQLPRPKARVAHLFRGSWKKDWAGEDSWEPEAEDPTSQTDRPTSASIPSMPYPTPLGRLSGSINLNE
ncbi:hypothetical protein DL93DRAFT_2083467 [Clavulina sp. PMI_390]|nr:hypothetical protein DL93DRAFT_2083467 [Clavulina sp. PMI_390]